MRHLRHKTADAIMSHNWNQPLRLFGGYSDEFESLLWYIDREARFLDTRLSISFPRGFNSEVIIRKVA